MFVPFKACCLMWANAPCWMPYFGVYLLTCWRIERCLIITYTPPSTFYYLKCILVYQLHTCIKMYWPNYDWFRKLLWSLILQFKMAVNIQSTLSKNPQRSKSTLLREPHSTEYILYCVWDDCFGMNVHIQISTFFSKAVSTFSSLTGILHNVCAYHALLGAYYWVIVV